MRSLFTLVTLLVWFLPSLASASALKGVRGSKRLKLSEPRNLLKEKKCIKFKESKEAVAEAHELKEPKAKDKVPVKGDKEAATLKVQDDKIAPEDKAAAPAPVQDKAPVAPKDKKAADNLAREAECLEWEEAGDREDGGSEAMVDPAMTSTGGSSSSNVDFDSINVDCEAIANDKGPTTDVHSVSFMVNIDVVKDAETTLRSIYEDMEQELQQKVAPRVAGCSSARFLADSSSETSKIVHVDFGELDLDNGGCDSSLAKEASEMDGVCMSSDVPVDVYFVGDFPENAIAKVEVAIEEHEWGVDGLLDTSEVAIVQTASSLGTSGDSDGPNAGMIGGIVAAVAVCAICGLCGYRAYKNRDEAPVAKAELETDEESDDEKKVAITTVAARRVG